MPLVSPMRVLRWFHRWSGVTLCAMFALWFLTGAVMVFVPFPTLPFEERAARSEIIDFGRLLISPAVAGAHFATGTVDRLVSTGSVPTYIGVDATGHTAAVSGETGTRMDIISGAVAGRVASRFGHAAAATVVGPFDYDQWVVYQGFDAWRPFYRIELVDRLGTDIYVSATTGEVIQRTRRIERAWNWVGSVTHWIYFVPLRKSFPAWDWVVWSLSLIASVTAVAGIWLGIDRMRAAIRTRRGTISPFRGLLRWHHIFGLIAGVFVAAWIISGWLSMDHGRLFTEGEVPAEVMSAYRNGAPSQPPPPPLTVQDLRRLAPASVISLDRIAGQEIASASGPEGQGVLLQSGGDVAQHVPTDVVLSAVRSGWPSASIRSIGVVARNSAYARAESVPAGALQVELSVPSPVSLYIDVRSGRPLVLANRGRRVHAWIYYMLHTYNFPGLLSYPRIRVVVLLVPLTLGFAFSVTAVLVGYRRLRLAASTA